MATFTKINSFVEALAEKLIDLSGAELTIEQAERLPDDRGKHRTFPGNIWLEDTHGSKYKPSRTSALKALTRGESLRWCWRGANYYGPETPAAANVPAARIPKYLEQWQKGELIKK